MGFYGADVSSARVPCIPFFTETSATKAGKGIKTGSGRQP